MSLFNKEAREHYMSMTSTTAVIRTVSVGNTVSAAIITAVLVCMLVWLFTGNITETVTVNGIVTTDGGNAGIYVSEGGVVSDVFVWNGANVNAGDVIAVIHDESRLEQLKLADAEELEQMKSKYYASSIMRAPKRGIISSVAEEGEYVKSGDVIATMIVIEEYSDNNKIAAFIPSNKGEIIKMGMEVQISPEYAPREEYGYALGYISDIEKIPKTKSKIIEEYSIRELENILDDKINYISVEITLISDSSSQSNIKWSNPRGSSVSIDIGTVCEGSVVVKKCKPYEWLFKRGTPYEK
ncbi:MAG: hypothetical protein J1F64_09335 [Oscillospiraceae bacterium]|nr:hypothetical protein [Oscillospiraceae bacterium]